jgi:AcrR family transcriptional regulator
MPKPTFFNLPDAKREMFIHLAFEEFALNDYRNASITNLVKRMNIAKGSVYQYFENKRDLYFYLIELASDEKLKTTGEFMKKPGNDFIRWYKRLLVASVTYDLENPLIGSFLQNVANERNASETNNLWLENQKQSMSFFAKKLTKQMEKKNLPKNTDVEILGFLLNQIGRGIIDYLSIRHNFLLHDYVRDNKPVDKIKASDIKAAGRQIASALEITLSK